jgi:hypothetical protein
MNKEELKKEDKSIEILKRIDFLVFLIMIFSLCSFVFLIYQVFINIPILTIEYRNQSCNNLVDTFFKETENKVPSENFTGTYTLDIYGKGYYEYEKLPQGNYTLLVVYREICGGLGYEGGCRYIKENLYLEEKKHE